VADRPTVKENLSAVLLVTVLFAGIGLLIWFLATHNGKLPEPKHVCPYCGQEIKVNLEKGEEKKL